METYTRPFPQDIDYCVYSATYTLPINATLNHADRFVLAEGDSSCRLVLDVDKLPPWLNTVVGISSQFLSQEGGRAFRILRGHRSLIMVINFAIAGIKNT